jgi:hypothetical protein
MMRRQLLHLWIVWGLFLAGCSAPAMSAASTPTPGIGVPVRAGDWEVTLNNISQPDQWSNMTPKSGYVLLALEASFHNLDAARETRVANDAVEITENDGQMTQPAGWSLQDNSNIDMIEVGELKKDPAAFGVTGGFGFVPTFTSKEDILTATYVFVFPEDSLAKPLKFQFEEVSIPIELNQ